MAHGPAFAIITNHHCDCSIRPSGAIEKHVKSINALLTNYYLCLSLSPHGCLAGRPAPPPPLAARCVRPRTTPKNKKTHCATRREKSDATTHRRIACCRTMAHGGARRARARPPVSHASAHACLAFFLTLVLSVCQPGSVSAGWGLIHTMRTMHWGANHMSTCHANASDT